jgi:acyl transferase domain-containing protein
MGESVERDSVDGVAIVGLAGRFPRAADVAEFWKNLREGVEGITFFSDEELLSQGVDPTVLSHPQYVKAKGVLEGVELFDAQFFGYTPRETRQMDPQHRLFLRTRATILTRTMVQSGYTLGSVKIAICSATWPWIQRSYKRWERTKISFRLASPTS